MYISTMKNDITKETRPALIASLPRVGQITVSEMILAGVEHNDVALQERSIHVFEKQVKLAFTSAQTQSAGQNHQPDSLRFWKGPLLFPVHAGCRHRATGLHPDSLSDLTRSRKYAQ